jgi:hypothetical protein
MGGVMAASIIFEKPFAQVVRLGYCRRPFVNLTNN